MVCLPCVVVPVVGATVDIGSPWSSAGDTAGGAAAPRASPLGERRGRTSSASDGHRCRAGAMSAAVAASSSGAPPDRYCATPNRVRSRLVPRARTSWRTRVVIGLGSPCVVGTPRCTSIATNRTVENEIFGPDPRCARRAPRWLAARETRSVRDRRGLESWSTRRERGWTERAGRSRQSTGTRARSRSRQSPR
jgi:hypothetical protein